MQLTHLHSKFDALQKQYGSPNLDQIYGTGCIERPDVCFVFMNPTGKNVASAKTWRGLKAPWIGTKNTWKLFNSVGVLSDETLSEIFARRPEEWDYDFARAVYTELANRRIYVTNLGKCTMENAHNPPDSIFRQYLGLLETEIKTIAPKKNYRRRPIPNLPGLLPCRSRNAKLATCHRRHPICYKQLIPCHFKEFFCAARW